MTYPNVKELPRTGDYVVSLEDGATGQVVQTGNIGGKLACRVLWEEGENYGERTNVEVELLEVVRP